MAHLKTNLGKEAAARNLVRRLNRIIESCRHLGKAFDHPALRDVLDDCEKHAFNALADCEVAFTLSPRLNHGRRPKLEVVK